MIKSMLFSTFAFLLLTWCRLFSSVLASSSQQQKQPQQHIGSLDMEQTRFHVGDGSSTSTNLITTTTNPSIIVLHEKQIWNTNYYNHAASKYYYRFTILQPGCLVQESTEVVTINKQYGYHGYTRQSSRIKVEFIAQAWGGSVYDTYLDQTGFRLCLQVDMYYNKDGHGYQDDNKKEKNDLIERKFMEFNVQVNHQKASRTTTTDTKSNNKSIRTRQIKKQR